MSIPSLPTGHCSNATEFCSQLERFKEAQPGTNTKKVFNRFLIENEEYMGSATNLISTLCKRFSLVRPKFQSEKATIADLPEDVLRSVLKDFGASDLSHMKQTNKTFDALIDDDVLMSHFPFGKEQWAKFLNVDIGVEPPLPLDINKILNEPCPIWPDKKIKDTHMLVLIPQSMGEEPLTVNNFGELLKQNYFPDTELGYLPRMRDIIKEFGDNPNDKSHWVLMAKKNLPKSENKSIAEQKIMLKEVSENAQAFYEAPTILQAMICIVTHYITSGKYLFDMGTCTRCESAYPSAVGSFSPSGITITYSDYNDKGFGIAPLRKL